MFEISEVVVQRSSRPEVFSPKGILKNFAKLRGKHLCYTLFFNKAADLRPLTLLKKNFAKFLRTSFFTEHL